MKRIILYNFMLLASAMQAQYWTEFSTAQTVQGTGTNSISIVDNSNVVWLSNRYSTNGSTPIRRYSRTTDGGVTWTTGEINLGTQSSGLQIANIHGISANVAYVAAYPNSAGVSGGIWKTEDGGSTWNKQTTAAFNSPTSFPSFVYFWDANEGICVGDPADGYFEIYKTSNGGANWTRVPQSPGLVPVSEEHYTTTNLFDVIGDTIYCGTRTSTFTAAMLKSTDRGQTWEELDVPATFPGDLIWGEYYFSFSDAYHGLLLDSSFGLSGTEDGGHTWTTIPVAADGFLRNFNIDNIPGMPNQYISIGYDPDGQGRGSSFTIDGGYTWHDIPDANDVDGGSIAFRDATTGFAGGYSNSPTDGGIFRWNGFILANATFSNDKAYVASPNPTAGATKISGNDIRKITVNDVFGNKIFDDSYHGLDHADLDMTRLSSGVYVVRITNAKGVFSTIKLIKR